MFEGFGIPSELGVCTGRLRSGVEVPPRPFEYTGEGCCSGTGRIEPSWLNTREVDLLAEKWEKMFFVSLRSLGDAGDSGWLWNGALGEARSALL